MSLATRLRQASWFERFHNSYIIRRRLHHICSRAYFHPRKQVRPPLGLLPFCVSTTDPFPGDDGKRFFSPLGGRYLPPGRRVDRGRPVVSATGETSLDAHMQVRPRLGRASRLSCSGDTRSTETTEVEVKGDADLWHSSATDNLHSSLSPSLGTQQSQSECQSPLRGPHQVLFHDVLHTPLESSYHPNLRPDSSPHDVSSIFAS